MTFRAFAEVYKKRHVLAKGLAMASTIDYRLKPLIERFGDRHISEIRTADIEDFVADMKTPRTVNGIDGQRLAPASINRTLGILRHMLNWAVGRATCSGTPRSSPPSATTTRRWKRSRPPSSVWRRARRSTPQPTSGTFFQVSFKISPASPPTADRLPPTEAS